MLPRRAFSSSIPTSGVPGKTRAWHPYDTKPLTRRSPHDDPALQPGDHFRSQIFQSRYPRGDIVGFDVDVNPALVLHSQLGQVHLRSDGR